MSELDNGERCIADDGYVGEHPQHIKRPRGFPDRSDHAKQLESYVRGRHETVNKRFKQFGAMKQVWRHELWSHGDAFHAVAVITQLAINGGEKLFECTDCRDPGPLLAS